MSRRGGSDVSTAATRPWRAVWAMLVGFFMTLIDWTAVSVANPSIMAAFHADYQACLGNQRLLAGLRRAAVGGRAPR